MSKINVSVLTRRKKLQAFRVTLDRSCPGSVSDLAFVQQSHNAVVFTGSLDGRPAFFKQYEHDDAAKWVRSSVVETKAVWARMATCDGGVAQLLWASEAEGVVATAAVPGTPVLDMMESADARDVFEDVGHWLHHYVGETAFSDRFSTSYWIRRRHAVKLDHLPPDDRTAAQDLLRLQASRAKALGTCPAWKGQAPRDFAPWNLHWTRGAVWAFDLEGHVVRPLAQVVARFGVLVVEQSQKPAADVLPNVVENLQTALKDRAAAPGLIQFAVGDMLFERCVKWAHHATKAPRIRQAIHAHLSQI